MLLQRLKADAVPWRGGAVPRDEAALNVRVRRRSEWLCLTECRCLNRVRRGPVTRVRARVRGSCLYWWAVMRTSQYAKVHAQSAENCTDKCRRHDPSQHQLELLPDQGNLSHWGFSSWREEPGGPVRQVEAGWKVHLEVWICWSERVYRNNLSWLRLIIIKT